MKTVAQPTELRGFRPSLPHRPTPSQPPNGRVGRRRGAKTQCTWARVGALFCMGVGGWGWGVIVLRKAVAFAPPGGTTVVPSRAPQVSAGAPTRSPPEAAPSPTCRLDDPPPSTGPCVTGLRAPCCSDRGPASGLSRVRNRTRGLAVVPRECTGGATELRQARARAFRCGLVSGSRHQRPPPLRGALPTNALCHRRGTIEQGRTAGLMSRRASAHPGLGCEGEGRGCMSRRGSL